MAGSNIHTVLPSGKKFPLLGLGTWQSELDKVGKAVETAIACGYRHIDAAYIYRNEKEVGDGIKAKIDDGTIKREDLFVTSKLWIHAHKPDKMEACCRESLQNLGLDYVDLYLMHWPMSVVNDKGIFPLDDDGKLICDDSIDYVDVWKLWIHAHKPDKMEACCRESLQNLGLDYVDLYLMHWPMSVVNDKGIFPLDDDGKLICDDSIDYVDVWKRMESLVDKRLVHAIGLSNYNVSQIQRILDLPPRHPIANLQVESHPFLAQNELIEFCKKHGITVTAYGPLGSPDRPEDTKAPTDPALMEHPVVCEIAKKRGVSPAQVLIRYQLQRGVAVIPKSVTPSRIEQNFEALKFELNKEEMQRLVDLNKDYRIFFFPVTDKLKYYPFSGSK